MSHLFLGPGLSCTSPLRDIKILYTHVAIDALAAAVRKENKQKNLILLNALHFNVSCIKRIKKNVNLMLLPSKSQSKKQ